MAPLKIGIVHEAPSHLHPFLWPSLRLDFYLYASILLVFDCPDEDIRL